MTSVGRAEEAIPVGRFARWSAKRQMRRAARLLKRKAIEKADYAALILDGVARLEGEPLRRSEGFESLIFGLKAAFALGGTVENPDRGHPEKYGPMDSAPAWMGGAMSSKPSVDSWDARELVFTWGEQADEILRLARIRLRPWNRWYQRVDRWRAEQTAFAPSLHGDVWKLIIMLAIAAASFAAGRLTAK